MSKCIACKGEDDKVTYVVVFAAASLEAVTLHNLLFDLKPETRNPKPETRNPKPETRNPKPETRTPKLETRNPKPETRNPKPET